MQMHLLPGACADPLIRKAHTSKPRTAPSPATTLFNGGEKSMGTILPEALPLEFVRSATNQKINLTAEEVFTGFLNLTAHAAWSGGAQASGCCRPPIEGPPLLWTGPLFLQLGAPPRLPAGRAQSAGG
jgi:hypothetical protein